MKTIELEIRQLRTPYERLRMRDLRGERTLVSSLSETGQQSPVIVVKGPDGTVVIDGHKRIRALKKLKRDLVRATVWEMTEAEALAMGYRFNGTGGRHAFEEGKLIEVLHRDFHWTFRGIGMKLLRSPSWVSRRLSLVEGMPAWLTGAIEEGRIGVNAAVVYVGPLWRHNGTKAKELVEKLESLELTDHQMREFLMSYRAAKGEVKEKMAADPALFLKARAAAQSHHDFNDIESRCVKNLTIMGQMAVGLVKSLPEALPTETGGPVREAIHKAWMGCEEKYHWLKKTASAVLGGTDAGSTDAKRNPDVG